MVENPCALLELLGYRLDGGTFDGCMSSIVVDDSSQVVKYRIELQRMHNSRIMLYFSVFFILFVIT